MSILDNDTPSITVVITDDMVRAACNAHGASQGACEFDWMRDALTAALAVGQSVSEK